MDNVKLRQHGVEPLIGNAVTVKHHGVVRLQRKWLGSGSAPNLDKKEQGRGQGAQETAFYAHNLLEYRDSNRLRAIMQLDATMSLEEVAKRARVSTATVSRVMNDLAGVRNATRARVLQAAAELRYHPNLHRQNTSRRP